MPNSTTSEPTKLDTQNNQSPDKKTIINMEFFKELTMNDQEFEKDLLALFKESSTKNMPRMREAIKVNDDQAWCIACHSFKGGANAIGAAELAQILEYGQKHSKETHEQKVDLLRKVENGYKAVIEFLESEIRRGGPDNSSSSNH